MSIYFHAPTHTYAIDGVRVPSVTELLAPLNDWSHVQAWALEAARCLGQDVHHAVNLLARDALDWKTLDPAIRPYVNAAREFLKETGGVVIASEQIVGSTVLKVAGTLDLLMHWRGWHYFIDWKVCATVPSTVGAQLAAYERLYEHTFCNGKRLVKSHRLCVRLRPNAYKVDRQHPNNGDWAKFRGCLEAYRLRERALSYA